MQPDQTPPAREPGTVYTFYSFKGGVGRSMALANIAALLAKAGRKILAVDWDLEAPGLEKYFQTPPEAVREKPGLIDWAESVASGKPLDWRQCLLTAIPFSNGGPVSILHAGRDDGNYAKRVQRLDWKKLFDEADFGEHLEEMRQQWIAEFEFVFIDSRTGLSDMGGICTIHLPDALIVFFTANGQSVDGVKKVVEASREVRPSLPFDRDPNFFCVPVPSRWESLTEHDISKKWQETFVQEFGPYYKEWLEPGKDLAQAVADISIPYKAFWSFGEQLPVVESVWQSGDPSPIYQRMADYVASGIWSGNPATRGAAAAVLTLDQATAEQIESLIAQWNSQPGDDPGRDELLASAHGRLAALKQQANDLKSAEQHLRAELEIRRRQPAIHDAAAQKRALLYARLSNLLGPQGRLQEWEAIANEHMQFAQETGDTRIRAAALSNLATACYALGHLDESLDLFKQLEASDEAPAKVISLNGQSDVLRALGRTDEALAAAKRAHDLGIESGDQASAGESAERMAYLYSDGNQFSLALATLDDAEQIFNHLGDQAQLTQIYAQKSLLLMTMGQLNEAYALLKKQETLALELGDRNSLQTSYGNQAAVLRQMDRLEEALEVLAKQAAICRELGLQAILAICLFNMAQTAGALGRVDDARRWASESQQLSIKIGAPAEQVERIQRLIRNLGKGSSTLEQENMASRILNYLDHNAFDVVSFERIRANIDEEWTDAELRDLTRKMPDKFMRTNLKDGKPGLRRAQRKFSA
jgi:tetratricopeptide (TPR) repeat protein/Mrp family chromosome partitioning ATPase